MIIRNCYGEREKARSKMINTGIVIYNQLVAPDKSRCKGLWIWVLAERKQKNSREEIAQITWKYQWAWIEHNASEKTTTLKFMSPYSELSNYWNKYHIFKRVMHKKILDRLDIRGLLTES